MVSLGLLVPISVLIFPLLWVTQVHLVELSHIHNKTFLINHSLEQPRPNHIYPGPLEEQQVLLAVEQALCISFYITWLLIYVQLVSQT